MAVVGAGDTHAGDAPLCGGKKIGHGGLAQHIDAGACRRCEQARHEPRAGLFRDGVHSRDAVARIQEALQQLEGDAVPVGQYGKEALIRLGQWDSVAPQVVQTQDASATLALVASGEAAFGIVYATDARAAEATGQAIEVSRFPADSHTPIIYPGAVVAGSDGPEAVAFLTFLQRPSASAVFLGQGFVVLSQ